MIRWGHSGASSPGCGLGWNETEGMEDVITPKKSKIEPENHWIVEENFGYMINVPGVVQCDACSKSSIHHIHKSLLSLPGRGSFMSKPTDCYLEKSPICVYVTALMAPGM